eukprot:GFKZ01012288.1.p1 GENE.GFKZ01012288.1~~GFKZ01012288.1.p1  ORF type:complete len:822 (-),score=129.80 GFKZ01012288.1:1981-4446(-)
MATDEVQPPVDQRRTIFRLDDRTAGKIGAGEVVVRPSNAVKELVENSLDASATSISVTVRNGGLRLLQVTDNGKGIYKGDLPLLCRRYCTSKLKSDADLSQVRTFGFRGEALASMSYVSRFSVLTKTEDDPLAWRAEYADSNMKGEPVAAAGVAGTTVTLDSLFYNFPARKKPALASEYYRQIVDVLVRYSLRFPHVAFSCRRLDDPSSSRLVASLDVKTQKGASVEDNIRSGFGAKVADDLFFFEFSVPRANAKVKGSATNANVGLKKQVFILFLNGRLVDCHTLKRSICDVYKGYLKTDGRPFAYLDVEMSLQDVDVNVHPQKKEVRFLHGDIIEEAIAEELCKKLRRGESSRKMAAQTVLRTLGSKLTLETLSKPNDNHNSREKNGRKSTSPSPSNLVKTSGGVAVEPHAKRVKLGRRGSSNQSQEKVNNGHTEDDGSPRSEEADDEESDFSGGSDVGDDMDLEDGALEKEEGASKGISSQRLRASGGQSRPPTQKPAYAKDKVRVSSEAPVGLFDVFLATEQEKEAALNVQKCRKRSVNAMPLLTSISDMIQEVRVSSHNGLAQILREQFFVGMGNQNFALIQYNLRLLAVEVDPLVTEVMYQQVLARFADFGLIQFDSPGSVMDLLEGYIRRRESKAGTQIDAESCATILLDNAAMLSEYFGIGFKGKIAADARLVHIPLLLPRIIPQMECVGEFLYDLAVKTDWSEEWSCLKGIALRIAKWYGNHWKPYPHAETHNCSNEDTLDKGGQRAANDDVTAVCTDKESGSEKSRREWVLRHIVFGALRKDFYPPRWFYTSGVIRELISYSKLFKIFERC